LAGSTQRISTTGGNNAVANAQAPARRPRVTANRRAHQVATTVTTKSTNNDAITYRLPKVDEA